MRSDSLRLARVLLFVTVAACGVPPSEPPAPGPAAPAPFSHDLLDSVLSRHVRDGLVDYVAVKQDPDFRAYIDALAEIDPESLPTRDERLAFWINAYNALVMKGVVDHYPIRSVSDVGLLGKWSFFKGIEFTIGGRSYTLDAIEHDVIRPTFQDSRVHFALVCASAGCPTLRPEAFHAVRVQAELDQSARLFINDRRKVRLDSQKRVLHLSSIFKWYEEDFIRSAGSVVGFVATYLEADLPEGVRIEHLPYSWQLNDLRTPPTS